MSDVSVFLRLRDEMSGGIGRVRAAMDAFNSTMSAGDKEAQGLAGTLDGIKGKLLALGATIGGVGLVKEVLELNRSFEQTQTKIAGTISAYKLAPDMGLAKEEAKKVMGTIEEMAAKLPGETEEYIQVFSLALPKAIEAGLKDVNQIATTTSDWMALASANAIDATQAGMDMYRVLAGQAGMDVRMFQVLQTKIGLTTEEFNKLARAKPEEALKKVKAAMEDFAAQRDLAAEGMDAKLGELESHIKTIKRLAGEGLFEAIKGDVTEINKYLSENRERIKQTAAELFKKLIPAFHQAVNLVRFLLDHLEGLVTATKIFVALWVAGSVMSAITSIIDGYVRMKEAIIAAQAASGAMGNSLLATAGKLGLLIGAAAVTYHVSQGMIDEANASHDKLTAASDVDAKRFVNSMTVEYKTGMAALATISKEYRAKAGMDAPSQTVEERSAAMAVHLKSKGYGMQQIMSVVGAVEKDAKLTEQMQDVGGMVSKSLVDRGAAYRAITETFTAPHVAQAKKAKAAPKARTDQHFDFRNSRFDIKQQFAEGFDPDRIAVSFAKDLSRMGEMRTQSGYAPTFGMRY